MAEAVNGFHEVSFPIPVARGARVTTKRKTEIVTLGSGHERRNARWAGAKRAYDAGGGLRSADDLRRVLEFYEARHGQLHGFRFRDPLDHRSCAAGETPAATDQPLGEGDGATTRFALVKQYGDTARPIAKPVPGTVLVAVDGASVVPPQITIDPALGLIDFASAPAAGAHVTAGFYFDVPVRFDLDALDVDLSAFTAGAIPTIPMIELFIEREPA